MASDLSAGIEMSAGAGGNLNGCKWQRGRIGSARAFWLFAPSQRGTVKRMFEGFGQKE